MKGGTLFSGIGAPELAGPHIDWRWCAEIDPFACALLAERFPDLRNLGDVNRIEPDAVEPVDLVVFGSPCQSFSVAGNRGGAADPRGALAFVALGIIGRIRPRWVVFENVPGLLSSASGRDFGAILGALAKCGYGLAYRILDAQFFGVPQRRRRVFVVGCLGDWRAAAAVLFERDGLRRDPPPRREAGQDITGCLSPTSPNSTRCFAIFAGQVIERQGVPRARAPKIGCSADQVYSQGRQCADNWRPSCSCAAKFAGRMASNTATGALSRTRGSPGGAWCSGTCCTSARSTTRRNWRGGGRSRYWRTARRNPARCRCFRRTAVKDCSRLFDCPRQAVGVAAAPAAAMGRVLAGAAAVARAAAGSVLVQAAGVEPQRDALGSGPVRAGGVSLAGAGQRMAAAS